MKQYVKKGSGIFSTLQLQYEGGWIVNGGLFYYNGEGMFYHSRNDYYKALFDKGKEVRRLMSIKDDEMMIYDEEQTVVYKGGFGDGYVKKGRGWRYEYENRKLKRVFVCENGEDVYKWIEMNDNQMIEYNENRLKIYQGEYMIVDNNDVIRNGEGDLFDNKEMIEYSGRWKMNKREGRGLYYKDGSLRYDGEWRNDKPNGRGQYLNNDGDVIFEGNWKNGYFDMGKGVWLYYEDGNKCGLYENGNKKYEGEFKDGKPNGRGVMFDENGSKQYEGEWKDGMLEIKKGVWFEYESDMICILYDNGKVRYRGEWKDDKSNGYGVSYYENGKKRYEGKQKDGNYHGKGVYY